ncbi:MAG: hypothetical protein PHI35_02415 [Victivallaceae bacterium]|nr:hypothetical protein [Victivallaceae bacterium]
MHYNISLRRMTRFAAAALTALVLAGCASSERMMRLSGGDGASHQPPRKERLGSSFVAAARPSASPIGLDASLINFWPFFFRGAGYYSVLWPFIDRDPYGFAVRPFYNREGNEYSVLFPLSAWNPVNGDGWVINGYWNKSRFGVVPLFQYSGDDRFNYCGPVWMWHGATGIFPLGSFGGNFNYCMLAYWQKKPEKFGFFPLFHCTPGDGGYAGLVYWNICGGKLAQWGVLPGLADFSKSFNHVMNAWWTPESFGFFPLCGFGDDWWYALPAWKSDRRFGVFPVLWWRDAVNHTVFPLYTIDDNGDFFLSPVVGWKRTPGERMLSVLGPLWVSSRRRIPDCDSRATERIERGDFYREESDFTLAGGLFYRGETSISRGGLIFHYVSRKNWEVLRPEVWSELKKVGISTEPASYDELKLVYKQIAAAMPMEEKFYCGVAPLFHYSQTGDRGNSFNLLLGLLAYWDKGQDRSCFRIGTGLLGVWEREEGGLFRHYRSYSTLCSESKLVIPELLFGSTVRRYYIPPAGSDAALKAIGLALSELSGACESPAARQTRGIINGWLNELEPGLSLPEDAVTYEAVKRFCTALPERLKWPTRECATTGWMPFYLHEKELERDNWIFPVLLSGHTTQVGRTTGAVLWPLYFYRRDTRAEVEQVVDKGAVLDTPQSASLQDDAGRILLAFGWRNQKVAVAAGSIPAQKLNVILEKLDRWSEVRGAFDAAERELGILRRASLPLPPPPPQTDTAPVVVDTASVTYKIDQAEKRSRQAAARLKQATGQSNEALQAAGLPALPPTAGVDAVAALRSRVAKENTGEVELSSVDTLLYNQITGGGMGRWSVLGLLARGEYDNARQKESVEVLKFLYRRRQEGTRSELLFFPFITRRTDGDDWHWSFMYRVFDCWKKGGETGGHIFFIPF